MVGPLFHVGETIMRHYFFAILLTVVFSAAVLPQGTPTPPSTHLKAGMPAPEFTLNDTAGKPVKLSDFKGKKNVVLAFYVLAFTGG